MKLSSLVKLNEIVMQKAKKDECKIQQLTYLTGHKLFASCFDEIDNIFVIPEGFEHITEYGLDAYKEKMECLIIPKSLSSIEENAFSRCGKLNEIKVQEGNTAFFVLDGTLYRRDTNEAVWKPKVAKDTPKASNIELKKEIYYLKKRIKTLEEYIQELEKKLKK